MKPLDIVLRTYEAASKELVGDRIRRKRVLGEPQTDAEQEIKAGLPSLLSAEIERSDRNPIDYRVYGSVGQINFPFARIPWVAALHREITTSTERGYYIVFLFREDMTGCVLSLNQGYTQFKGCRSELPARFSSDTTVPSIWQTLYQDQDNRDESTIT